MPTTNRSLIKKADLALANLVSDGGLLLPAQAKSFIRLLIKQGVMLSMARVIPMASFKQRINKVRFQNRVLRAGSENTALAAADRVKPDFTDVELDAKKFMAEIHLNNEVLEDNLERGQLSTTVMELLTEAITRDIDEVVIEGDTASADTFLKSFDGLIKQASSNTHAAGGVPLTKDVLRDTIKTLPKEWLRRKSQMRFLTGTDAVLDYQDHLSNRQTPLGDINMRQDEVPLYSGIPVIDVPMMPEDLGGGNETDLLFLDPKNIVVGFWRQIRFETDKDIRAGHMIVVATMRFDVKYEEELAVVKTTGITVS